MLTVWALTVLGNILLSLLLIWREWSIRFPWLTLSAILAVFCDFIFWYLRNYHHASYLPSRTFVFFLWIGMNGMVIAETWNVSKVRIPVELQTLAEIVLLLLKKAGLLWTVYYLDCTLRVTNLIMIVWFLKLFSKPMEELYERTRRKALS